MIAYYFDEHMDHAIVDGLRRQGVDFVIFRVVMMPSHEIHPFTLSGKAVPHRAIPVRSQVDRPPIRHPRGFHHRF